MPLLKHPVTWGVVFTIAIVALGLWIGSAEHCFHDGACVSKFQLFLRSDPNEVGDTLAGFAGALAFVWIIVTVWLQSLELAAQRAELVLTRREMAEQRKATQDMAKSMAAQAEIFAIEASERRQAARWRETEELILDFQEILSETFFYWRPKDGSPDGWGAHGVVFGHKGEYEKVSRAEYFRQMRALLKKDRSHVKVGVKEGKYAEYPTKDGLPEALRCLEEIISNLSLLSPEHQSQLNRLHLEDLKKELLLFMSEDIWMEAE